MKNGTLILTQNDIQKALTLKEYLPIIEEAHALHAQGQIYPPDFLHADVNCGEFHLKTGGIRFTDKEYFGVKINGGFPKNEKNYGFHNILGIIYICDAQNGYPLAIMDSVTISKWRTGAATAIATKYLVAQDNIRLGIFGYGAQAEIQAKAISLVKNIHCIYVSGWNQEKAQTFSEKLTQELHVPVEYCPAEENARQSNVIVTTTPSKQYYIHKEWIQPGTFIAAVGADSPGKQELDPHLVASAIIVTDIRKQACQVGESQHAISQLLMNPENIYAELGELIIGKKQCPDTSNSITIYDSTGTALQDISIGIAILEKLNTNHCHKIHLFQ